MYTCKHCGKLTKQLYCLGNQIKPSACQGCYIYFKKGGTINPLPDAGCIAYDVHGKVICHLCGRAYTRLGSHIKESHFMTIAEYKESFGLCKRTKTTEQSYSHTMRDSALRNGMDDQLKRAGKNTRIAKGENSKRKGKKICLQNYLSNHFIKQNGKTKEDYLRYLSESDQDKPC